MDRRHQVFVSSTFRDLSIERTRVITALLQLGAIPAGMELFPASDDDQWTLICRVIDECDYYLVIIGGRYGSTDSDGIGYTEKEYDYAVEVGKPIIAFLHGDPDKIAVEKSDIEGDVRARLVAFREKAQRKMVRYWATPEELEAQVYPSYLAITRSHPAVGWIRADTVASTEALNELAAAREELTRLRSELVRAQGSPPQGTASLAQGTDDIEIEWAARVRKPDGVGLDRLDGKVSISWDDIFKEIGPLMLGDSAETRLNAALRNLVAKRLTDTGMHVLPPVLSLEQDLIHAIKTQFLALGLIRMSDRKRGVRDTDTYWSLTPYGQDYLLKLRARQRGGDPAD